MISMDNSPNKAFPKATETISTVSSSKGISNPRRLVTADHSMVAQLVPMVTLVARPQVPIHPIQQAMYRHSRRLLRTTAGQTEGRLNLLSNVLRAQLPSELRAQRYILFPSLLSLRNRRLPRSQTRLRSSRMMALAYCSMVSLLGASKKQELTCHGTVKALYNYTATTPEEFDFQTDDIIAVTATPDDGWWSGVLLDDTRRVTGRTVFPSNFVCLF